MFTAALFTTAKIWRQTKCPSIYKCLKKMWYLYIMEYYSAEKKMKNLTMCNNMDGSTGYYTK